METILATAFGRKVKVQRGENDEIIEAARGMFESLAEGSGFAIPVLVPLFCESVEKLFVASLSQCYIHADSMPWLDFVLRPFVSGSMLVRCSRTLYRVAKVIIRQRRENPTPQKVTHILSCHWTVEVLFAFERIMV